MSGEDTNEILIHLQHIREKLDETNTHLKELNRRTAKTETRVAVLEDRSDRQSFSAAKWGAGVGAAISALVAALSQVMGGK